MVGLFQVEHALRVHGRKLEVFERVRAHWKVREEHALAFNSASSKRPISLSTSKQ
jgi:hypothetical protein